MIFLFDDLCAALAVVLRSFCYWAYRSEREKKNGLIGTLMSNKNYLNKTEISLCFNRYLKLLKRIY